ncbi:MAG: hypothetical protein AAGJ86_09900 [Pseudomonadota bacterium]
MEVSNFELVFKPQSPVGPADTVLQGYFLKISNLEDVELIFRLDFFTSSITDPDRSLQNNAAVLVDIAGQNNQSFSLQGALDAKSFRLTPSITIPPCATALVAVLPSDPFAMAGEPANFETRGYVTIRLPATFRPIGNRPFGILQPQLDRPAKVLLTPQNRALYIGEDGSNNAQTQSSLPLATGQALFEVPPEPGIFFPETGFELPELFERESRRPSLDFSAEALAMQLAAVSASDMDLKSFNKALRDAGVGMAIEKRKVED